MNSEVERQLLESLADLRMSGDEKAALRALGRDFDTQQRAFARNRAFDMAREALADSASPELLLKWLQQVQKSLTPAVEPGLAEAYACFSPGDDCRRTLMQLLRRSRRSVDICVFTISDDRLTDSIIDAHQAGTAIRIITDDDKQFDRGSDIGRLQQAGVPLAMDRSSAHMHHKFAIFDGRLLANGSFNWTRSASRYNQENIAVSADANLVKAFIGKFELLWKQWV